MAFIAASCLAFGWTAAVDNLEGHCGRHCSRSGFESLDFEEDWAGMRQLGGLRLHGNCVGPGGIGQERFRYKSCTMKGI